jgi:hypothetical protein
MYDTPPYPRVASVESQWLAKIHFKMCMYKQMPVPVAARSKAWVCSRSLTGIAGSNPTGGMDVLSDVSVVCCQVEVSVTS